MPVADMLARMSSRELTEWLMYAQLEPFGEQRADLRNAISTAAIVNHLRGLAGAKGRPAKIEDFLPFREEAEREEPSGPELVSKISAVFGRKPKA